MSFSKAKIDFEFLLLTILITLELILTTCFTKIRRMLTIDVSSAEMI